MRFLICLLLMLPALARAQSLTLGEYPQVQTHFGLLSVVETPQQGVSRLYLQGYTQPLHENRWITIRGAFIAPGETANWVLVETMHSGNMCPVSYLVLRIEQGRLNRSDPFGDCLGRIEDAQLVPGRFTLVLKDPDLNVAARRFTFDGAQITEETLAAAPNTAAPAGAGTDVTRWIGQHTTAPFEDASERARFATILTAEDLENLRASTSVAGRTEVRGDWVFGAGCMPHQCNAQAGFWGLRISDGAAVAGIFRAGGAHRYFGAPQVLSDPAVGAFVAEKALR